MAIYQSGFRSFPLDTQELLGIHLNHFHTLAECILRTMAMNDDVIAALKSDRLFFFMFLLILFFRFFIFCENFVQHFRNLYNRKKNKWQLIFENENENYIINPINPFGECDKNCQFGLIVKERKCTSLLFLFFPHSSQGSCVTCPFHVNHLAWVSIF